MSQSDLATTVGSWVARYPQTSRVFESLQIDYCCGGNKSLEQACWERQLDPQHVIAELGGAIKDDDASADTDWQSVRLTELCDNIEQTHHAYLKEELPRLTQVVEKVTRVHGAAHPELSAVREQFAALRAELEPHMFKEERVLFPSIRQMEQSDGVPDFPFGSIANPIRTMEHEHDNAGDALATIRRLTKDYAVPEGACNTYRGMLDRLARLERDMHRHVHKENQILFPRAIEQESSLGLRENALSPQAQMPS